MKKQLVLIALVTIATLLQAVVATRIRIAGIAPDLLAIFVIAIAADYGSMQGLSAGFFGGLVLDVLFGYPLGLRTIGYTLIGYLAGLNVLSAFRGYMRLTLLAFLLLAGRDLAQVIIAFLYRMDMEGNMVLRMIGASLYSAVWLLPLQWIMRKIASLDFMDKNRLFSSD